jgi:hypothetical protein
MTGRDSRRISSSQNFLFIVTDVIANTCKLWISMKCGAINSGKSRSMNLILFPGPNLELYLVSVAVHSLEQDCGGRMKVRTVNGKLGHDIASGDPRW